MRLFFFGKFIPKVCLFGTLYLVDFRRKNRGAFILFGKFTLKVLLLGAALVFGTPEYRRSQVVCVWGGACVYGGAGARCVWGGSVCGKGREVRSTDLGGVMGLS